MYDTLVAYTYVRHLDASLFDGGAVYEDFGSGRQSGRYWINSDDQQDYQPQFTYFPTQCLLRVQVSLEKLINAYRIIHTKTVDDALNALDAVIAETFSLNLPSVREWHCTRIDYAWTWLVHPDVATYIAAVKDVHLARMNRADFDTSGVVWKNASRWVKIYDKSKEAALDGQWLRFEVSNYKNAVKYMCEHWFDCENTVDELLRPGRALYVLARYLELVGLHKDAIDMRVPEMVRLRDVFGRGAAAAYWHLCIIREHGRNANNTSLTSSASMSAWSKKLRDAGFIIDVDDKQAPLTHLKGLRLPTEDVTKIISQNVGTQNGVSEDYGLEKFWKNFGVVVELPDFIQRRIRLEVDHV